MLLWHGSQRWDGRPEIRRGRKGRSEYGPGIYLTTNLETAWRYAKGGGRLYLFELDDTLTWIQGQTIPLFEMLAFINDLSRMTGRKAVYRDLIDQQGRFEEDRVPASILVNVMVNHDSLRGDNGPALARFLTDRGLDADCDKKGGREDWVILFNPKKVVSFTARSRREIPVEMYDLPKVC